MQLSVAIDENLRSAVVQARHRVRGIRRRMPVIKAHDHQQHRSGSQPAPQHRRAPDAGLHRDDIVRDNRGGSNRRTWHRTHFSRKLPQLRNLTSAGMARRRMPRRFGRHRFTLRQQAHLLVLQMRLRDGERAFQLLNGVTRAGMLLQRTAARCALRQVVIRLQQLRGRQLARQKRL